MKNRTIFVACDTSNLKKIKQIITQTKLAILDNLKDLSALNSKELIQQRREKFLKIGRNI